MRPSRSAHSLALIEQRIADSNNLSQANRLADCYPDHFFSSTSERAADTLEDVCLEAYGEIPPYERLRGLKEWNFGAYEGEDNFLNPAPPFGDFFVPYGGDSQETLVARMRKATEEIMSRPDVSCALAVSHGAACANFIRSWKDANVVQYHPGIKNCSIFTFAYDEGAHAFSCIDIFEPDFAELG